MKQYLYSHHFSCHFSRNTKCRYEMQDQYNSNLMHHSAHSTSFPDSKQDQYTSYPVLHLSHNTTAHQADPVQAHKKMVLPDNEYLSDIESAYLLLQPDQQRLDDCHHC